MEIVHATLCENCTEREELKDACYNKDIEAVATFVLEGKRGCGNVIP